MELYEATFESLRERPLPTWFDDAKFGIFVHWYPSSIPAFAPLNPDPFTLAREQGEFVAFSESPYSEWYVNSLAIEGSSVQRHHAATYGDKPYDEFVDEFFAAAEGWDPQDWAELFAAAGATYCVMGTKHLDGALLWPSDIPNPFKGAAYTSPRDIVGDCIEAVRAVGLRAGIYYCGGLDITFQGLGFHSWATVFGAIPQSDEYHRYATGHYRELIDRYRPDVLWNDVGFPGFGAGAAPLMAEYYAANPDGVVNDRFDPFGVAMGQAHADFVTPEYSLERTVSTKKFEVCRGIGTSFGYNQLENESTYLPADRLIELLVDVVADGGNLLLNVGPLPSGEVPAAQRDRLLAIGSWLDVNGDAIYGSRPHALSSLDTADGARVRLTAGADGAVYAMVVGHPVGRTVRIEGLPAGRVTMLGVDGELTRTGDAIDLPAEGSPTGPVYTLRVDAV
jgi:alpha-L-fucosidase